ncbi:Cro/CI family transcriptional regulator [Pseudomonas syringae group genomosp. 3]|uniref:Cro/CI family transcriptional regulator n=1 Tax=Pseudomonas syringae group genomosp. 3 TaxID=251701 RepID=UPI000EFF6F9A|nr:Cro/CI family transcriptional regulator [Pseudomonas syringae group genomosp. 3]MBM0211847.1 hypothetical protein [Pseudomonas syringae pv. maculicola]
MTPIPLSVFVQDKGQDEAAKLLGSSQAAICKALKSGRLILVHEDHPGIFSAIELKGFPSSGLSQKARPNLEQIVEQISRFGKGLGVAVQASSTAQASP